MQMEDRRAAQLAAAAELAGEQPLLLSSGPDSPALERWIQRQLGQEGERLHRLRQKLWKGVTWKRNDRVLLVGVRSLVWALDPLKGVPEGGVTLLLTKEEDRPALLLKLKCWSPNCSPNFSVVALKCSENCRMVNALTASVAD